MQCVQVFVTVKNAAAAVAVGGVIAGEAPLLLTLPANGASYLSAEPLRDTGRHYGLTRRLEFQGGRPFPAEPGMTLFDWGRGLYEAELWCGALPCEREQTFPFTLAQRPFEGMNAVLYHDAGLWLSLESGRKLLAGYPLGDGVRGALFSMGRLLAAIGEGAADGCDTARVIAPDRTEAGFFSADRIANEGGNLLVEEALHTRRAHVRRTVYAAEGVRLTERSREIVPTRELPEASDAPMAFCEAVQYGLSGEALGYLAPALAAELTEEQIRDFFSDFSGVRPFLTDSSTVGLVGAGADGTYAVRRIEFEMEQGRITNISEDV